MLEINKLIGTSRERIDETEAERLRKEREVFLFDSGHATRIIDFAQAMADKAELMIIHCGAGISRSGAVGTWLNEFYGNDYLTFRRKHSFIMPNYHVLEVLRDAHRRRCPSY